MEQQIKVHTFTQTFNAATTGSFPCDLGSKVPLVGEILELDTTFNRAGSFAMYNGRTAEVFWTSNAISGAATTVVRPRTFSQANNGSIAGALHVPYTYMDPIWLSVSGAASGTQVFSAHVRYR